MWTLLLLVCQTLPFASGRTQAADLQERALIESTRQHERENEERQELQRRNFEAKFNRLVDAVANFARQYNEGKGQVWPKREAEKLRDAMKELQSLEKSLNGRRPTGENRTTETPAPSPAPAQTPNPPALR